MLHTATYDHIQVTYLLHTYYILLHSEDRLPIYVLYVAYVAICSWCSVSNAREGVLSCRAGVRLHRTISRNIVGIQSNHWHMQHTKCLSGGGINILPELTICSYIHNIYGYILLHIAYMHVTYGYIWPHTGYIPTAHVIHTAALRGQASHICAVCSICSYM